MGERSQEQAHTTTKAKFSFNVLFIVVKPTTENNSTPIEMSLTTKS